MLILTVNGLKVLGPVLAPGPVSRLTVNNPNANEESVFRMEIQVKECL